MARISKTYGRLLAVLMAWLGFSCADEYGPCEYGTLEGAFNVKAGGVVVSDTDNAPIEGIRAVLKTRPNEHTPFQGIDTVYTDGRGVFNLTGKNLYITKLYVELSDADGDKNGSFIDKDVEADCSNEKFAGGNGNQYLGEAQKNLGTLKMKPKKE